MYFFSKTVLDFYLGECAYQVSEYFDFFGKTARTLLDDDPIDVAASHTKMSELKHAIPLTKAVAVFGQTQFIFKGIDFLFPKLFNRADDRVRRLRRPSQQQPKQCLHQQLVVLQLFEYYVLDDSDRSDATDVTARFKIHSRQCLPM